MELDTEHDLGHAPHCSTGSCWADVRAGAAPSDRGPLFRWDSWDVILRGALGALLLSLAGL